MSWSTKFPSEMSGRRSVDLYNTFTNLHSCTFSLISKRNVRHPSTTGPEFDCNSSYFLAISCHPFTAGPCVLVFTLPKSSSLQAGMAQPHRDAPTLFHSPHTGQRKTVRSQVFRFFSSCLWFVNTSVSVQQLPGLYLMTIEHLHEKVDKGWNSGGGLATKRPIYSVQSERDTEREGRRRSWEGSWINELKMLRSSVRLNSFGFI